MAAESSCYERQWWVERWCGRETEEFDPLLKIVEKQDQKQYITKWQSQLPSWPSSYYPLPSAGL
ncbi:hypothetical protein C364_06421 [Cryptococcus neoformans Bt63]|nr:hypothetical protein C364_06421 [Cryptococcus neoformans var. grubii Bt63]